MPAMRHRARPNERPIEVDPASVESWERAGYRPVEPEPKPRKAPAKKAAASKSE